MQSLKKQATATLLEHIYTTEDTLFQIAYDRRFRPELYRLKTEGTIANDAAQRYQLLLTRYREDAATFLS